MSIEEMLIGYTINGAKQLGIEAKKGSIEVGKDADFLVFERTFSRSRRKASATTCRRTCSSAERK